MALTKEQKSTLINRLDFIYGHVRLKCDGYTIDLNVERCKGLRMRVVTYVNGSWKGEWLSGMNRHPEQKFLRKSVRQAMSQKQKASMEKAVGKREFKKMCNEPGSIWSKTLTIYDISWANGRTAINHLCKVCDSIEILIPESA